MTALRGRTAPRLERSGGLGRLQDGVEGAPSRRVVIVALCALTVVAAALRFPFLSHQSLWYDEVFTRTIVGRHSFGAIWDQIRQTESTPPLYYVITKLTSDVLGTRGTLALRVPSAVALTAAVPVSFLSFRDLIGRRSSLAAAAFVAVNPLLVSYATDARSYALLVLTALLSIWAFSAILTGGNGGAYIGWFAASVACVWTHYFGAITVLAEAVILLVAVPERRRTTIVSALLIVVCVLPLVPLLLHQSEGEDSAWIAGLSLSGRVTQTVRQFGMGANVPRAWLEVTGLLLVYLGLAAGVMVGIRQPRYRLLLLIAVATVGIPLAASIIGIDDRFYVRNVIALVPLLGALSAPALLRARGIPLALYLLAALVTSVWVATNWRYEVVNWRAAIVAALPLDHRVPVISVGVNDANVVATYLRRAPDGAPILARHALLLVEPYRGPHDRALVPAPLTPILDAMRGFRASSLRVKDGVQIITLTSRTPTLINPAAIPDATVFPPSR